MAEPARHTVVPADEPPLDPSAVEQAYRHYRAKRRARVERRREQARARLRFLVVTVILTALALAREGMPLGLLPGPAAAHRTPRQRRMDRDAVATLRAMELALRRRALRPEPHELFIRRTRRVDFVHPQTP